MLESVFSSQLGAEPRDRVGELPRSRREMMFLVTKSGYCTHFERPNGHASVPLFARTLVARLWSEDTCRKRNGNHGRCHFRLRCFYIYVAAKTKNRPGSKLFAHARSDEELARIRHHLGNAEGIHVD